MTLNLKFSDHLAFLFGLLIVRGIVRVMEWFFSKLSLNCTFTQINHKPLILIVFMPKLLANVILIADFVNPGSRVNKTHFINSLHLTVHHYSGQFNQIYRMTGAEIDTSVEEVVQVRNPNQRCLPQQLHVSLKPICTLRTLHFDQWMPIWHTCCQERLWAISNYYEIRGTLRELSWLRGKDCSIWSPWALMSINFLQGQSHVKNDKLLPLLKWPNMLLSFP